MLKFFTDRRQFWIILLPVHYNSLTFFWKLSLNVDQGNKMSSPLSMKLWEIPNSGHLLKVSEDTISPKNIITFVKGNIFPCDHPINLLNHRRISNSTSYTIPIMEIITSNILLLFGMSSEQKVMWTTFCHLCNKKDKPLHKKKKMFAELPELCWVPLGELSLGTPSGTPHYSPDSSLVGKKTVFVLICALDLSC